MNKHIELVKKWLDNPDSVTAEELRVNANSAAAYDYASYADATDAVLAAYVGLANGDYVAADTGDVDTDYAAADAAYTVLATYSAAYNASRLAANHQPDAESIADWVKRYEELTR